MPPDHQNRYLSRVGKTTRSLAVWTGAWVLTCALLAFGPKFIWAEIAGVTLAAIVLNITVGIAMVLANIKHLASLDEMQKQIQLEAMGITLGVGLIVSVPYSMMDAYNLIAFDAVIGGLVAVMGLTYLVSTLWRARSYR